MTPIITAISTTTLREFEHGRICVIDDHPDCIMIEAFSGYIPKMAFKEMFLSLAELIKTRSVSRVIFDKSRLTVFHQPSMEWYFLEWKPQMYDLGVKVHRKILPSSHVFQMSASIARQKLERLYPDAKFKLMDIKYSRSVEDALFD